MEEQDSSRRVSIGLLVPVSSKSAIGRLTFWPERLCRSSMDIMKTNNTSHDKAIVEPRHGAYLTRLEDNVNRTSAMKHHPERPLVAGSICRPMIPVSGH